MLRQGLSIVALVSMTACTTSSSDSNAGGTAAAPAGGGATGGATGGSTGGASGGTTGGTTVPSFAIGDALPFAQNPSTLAYSVAPTATSVDVARTDSGTNTPDQATYDVTINGVTYNLTPNALNKPNGANNSFEATNGSTLVTLFLNENAVNATIANTQIDKATRSQQFFSIVGTPTDTANLPTAMATYSGNGEISIDTGKGAFDDAPATTVTFDADFSAGTLNGQFDVSDPAGDGSGPVDIAGSAILPMTGTIQGNTFTADVDYSELVNISNGLALVKPGSINGGFFGAAGEEAVGIGINMGKALSPNDSVIYTRIQATNR